MSGLVVSPDIAAPLGIVESPDIDISPVLFYISVSPDIAQTTLNIPGDISGDIVLCSGIEFYVISR